MAGRQIPIPYCGTPPDPGQLLHRWNLDPVLIAALAVIWAAYAIGASRAGAGRREKTFFHCGWALTAAALISPLCPLSVSLFAARVGQHMILTLVAAPLVAAGRPGLALRGLLGRRCPLPARGEGAAKSAVLAAGLFWALLWYWHAPGPYAATFESTVVYWTMHLTVYGSALWLWSALLAQPHRQPVWTIAAGLVSTAQMGLLGALITLAPRALYAPHFTTTFAWGLTPLQDQQLGGAIMWVPGCAVFLMAAMAELSALLTDPAERLPRLRAMTR
ncbi:MAG TPA: cytochrome c oxidase assembly protein [Caulobacteraceae bacterium]